MEITVETNRFVVRSGGSRPAWCAKCSASVRTITPQEAAILAGVGERTIHQWVEGGFLHLLGREEGTPGICLDSLLRSTDE